ncbi:MAG TPA: DNA polymerase III subunit beta [Candidatus Omnitrophota bacterium]|nr:DNA polymerase III subunit beta [Candidatus Omnitrophota bacterium]
MKFNTTKDVLLKGIQSVQAAIGTKANLPILSNILIEGTDDEVVMTTTDLDIGIISTIPIKPSVKGAITIPAKKFSDIIKELPDKETISISVKKNNLVNIDCEKNSFKIMGLPKEEFPQVPAFKDKDSITLQQKTFKKMLSMTNFAISHDETRYVLNGVLAIIKPSFIRLVATDGRRLAVIEEKMQLPKTLERKIIIPIKAVSELLRVLGDEGDVKICFAENQAFFDVGVVRIISRLIEGEFPNYEQVIPKEIKDKIVLSRDKFLSGIKRVALFTNPDSMAVKIDLAQNKIVLSKNTPYLGEARVELEADYKGKELSVGFNPDYLADLLKNIEDEKVNFEIVDSEKPGVVRIGSEYTYVVLPMQIT